jgi:hypothetical protein
MSNVSNLINVVLLFPGLAIGRDGGEKARPMKWTRDRADP